MKIYVDKSNIWILLIIENSWSKANQTNIFNQTIKSSVIETQIKWKDVPEDDPPVSSKNPQIPFLLFFWKKYDRLIEMFVLHRFPYINHPNLTSQRPSEGHPMTPAQTENKNLQIPFKVQKHTEKDRQCWLAVVWRKNNPFRLLKVFVHWAAESEVSPVSLQFKMLITWHLESPLTGR